MVRVRLFGYRPTCTRAPRNRCTASVLRGFSSLNSLSSFPAGKEWHQYRLGRRRCLRSHRDTRTRTLLPGAPVPRTRLTPCSLGSSRSFFSLSLSLSPAPSASLCRCRTYTLDTHKISRARTALSRSEVRGRVTAGALSAPHAAGPLASSYAVGTLCARDLNAHECSCEPP